MAQGQCLPGLQGWPVQVADLRSNINTLVNEIKQPSDIKLQFGKENVSNGQSLQPTSGWIAFNGNHTFLLGGQQYTVKDIRFCKPINTTITITPSTPIGEYQVQGQVGNSSMLACLSIPVYIDTTSTAGSAIIGLLTGKETDLLSTIPMSTSVQIMRYSTCVESVGGPVYTIQNAHWINGISITTAQFQTIPGWNGGGFASGGFSGVMLYKGYFANTYELNDGGKSKITYSLLYGYISVPYTLTPGISVSTTQFTQAFRIIVGFTEQNAGNSTNLATNSFKCTPINPLKDIKNGQIQIDPRTGKLLSDELNDLQNQQNASLNSNATILPGDIAKYIGIAFGVLIGIVLLYYLYQLCKYIYTKNSLPSIGSIGSSLATKFGTAVGDVGSIMKRATGSVTGSAPAVAAVAGIAVAGIAGAKGAQPVARGAQPVARGAQPLGPGAQPVGTGVQPLGPGLQPLGPGETYTEQMAKRIAARKAKGVAPRDATTTGPTEATGSTEATDATAPTDAIGTVETYAEQMAKRIAERKAKGITTLSTITGLKKPVIPTAEDLEAAGTALATTAAEDLEAAGTALATTAAEGATSAIANATGLPPALGTHAARAAAYAAARKKKLTVQPVETGLTDAKTKELTDASKAAGLTDAETKALLDTSKAAKEQTDSEIKALADASKAAKEQGEQAVASSKRAATLAREALEKSGL